MNLRHVPWGRVLGTLAVCVVMPAPVQGQDLADFDYENLSFRGIGIDVGHIWANRVEETNTLGLRVDLGYLGPGVRILPSLTFWDSRLERREVAKLEASVERLIEEQAPGSTPDVDLGRIDWSDVVIGLDAQIVWAVPLNLLTYAGLGGAVHFLNGDGAAVNGTFVEDLLDSAKAGLNVHAGLEYPWERFRIHAGGRFEILEDLRYFEFRFGGAFMWGSPVPGERR